MQNQDEIQKIIEHNDELSSNFSVWPVIFFFLGLVIAAMAYHNTIA